MRHMPVVLSILSVALVAGSPTARAGDTSPVDGAELYEDACANCHSMTPGRHKKGPSLAGIIGRRAGTTEGYDYSEALSGANITWTPENLGKFLAGPREMIPGTRMKLRPPLSPEEVSAVMKYLSQQQSDGARVK